MPTAIDFIEFEKNTGSYLSEGLIFSSIKPKYDEIFFWDLPDNTNSQSQNESF